jgi:hypothetical protein
MAKAMAITRTIANHHSGTVGRFSNFAKWKGKEGGDLCRANRGKLTLRVLGHQSIMYILVLANLRVLVLAEAIPKVLEPHFDLGSVVQIDIRQRGRI